jgi:O-antigen/teichoic acid export membrane protein
MMIAVGVLIFSLAGEWLLRYWLNDSQVVGTVFPILAVLLVGSALNAIYTIGYINWIAHEKIYRIFQVNTLGLALSVALIPPLVSWHGAIGAAFGWVAMNLVGFVISLGWLIPKKNV